MATVGIILNLLSFCTIVLGKRIHKEVKIQLANLAMANVLAGLVPAYSEQVWITKTEVPCQILSFFGYGAFYAGLLWNMVIGLERVVVVFFPFRALRYTKRHKIAIATVVWIVGLGSAIEYLAIIEEWYGVDEYYCLSQDLLPFTNPPLYLWLTVFKYSLPALLTMISYIAITVKTHRRSHVGERIGSQKALDEKLKNRVCLLILIL